MEWIQVLGAVLAEERQVELRFVHEGTAAKRRLGAELREHQLFDRIVEKSPSRAEAGFARSTGAPCHADAWSKGFVVCLRHASRNSGITWNDQADGALRGAVGIWSTTRKHARGLPGAESLHVLRLSASGVSSSQRRP